ncbi:nucleotidyltransferase family protein [Panacibacter sp. DH6]|uniref:Nucleotidyltransferase family protein n=1 Tax=Panacibacter microcysteis TaxID=2793269 RepID=A0A931E8N6_9BACT|nr:nucleotidyltransferase family protein [Panacibacter microcysteis]MBG9377168.1 nucleotidyltransferase family protein [Panacibacter microcysteis]
MESFSFKFSKQSFGMISIIVLAAGLSTRMGRQNKLLLPFDGSTIIETTINNIIHAAAGETIVVTGYEAAAVTAVIKHLPVTTVYNGDFEKGMTTSIQKGVMHAGGKAYMICLSDMYAVSTGEYVFMLQRFEEIYQKDKQCICIPVYNGAKGNPVIFSAYYKKAILQHDEMEGCKAIVQVNRQHVYAIPMQTPAILKDVDYPEDYEKIAPAK